MVRFVIFFPSPALLGGLRPLKFFRYGKYRTLCMIKPGASQLYYEKIKSIIVSHGFEIVTELHQKLTIQQAQEFYAEHQGKPFFETLVSHRITLRDSLAVVAFFCLVHSRASLGSYLARFSSEHL